MTNSICVVTGSRAEFGLLRPLLLRLSGNGQIDLRLVATGSHLSRAYGNTQSEIASSGLTVHRCIPIPMEGDSKADMANATGFALSAFTQYFTDHRPDILLVLGDRYEIFAAASSAAILGIPIAHIHGGETTEGAVDEFFRHSITKMSTLHFTACEEYRRRVIQMGEAPQRVFNVGALGVENVLTTTPMTLDELVQSIGFCLKETPYSVVTFHPATLEDSTAIAQLTELIAAMDAFPDMRYLITKANADAGGRAVNQMWEHTAANRQNWLVVSSLGVLRYLSALHYARMMIGNSSSGIIEAPALHLPTVNIGDRQKGRMMADSILCCQPERDSIIKAMQRAVTPEFRQKARQTVCPFGDGNTSARIYEEVKRWLQSGPHNSKKSFFDLRVEV